MAAALPGGFLGAEFLWLACATRDVAEANPVIGTGGPRNIQVGPKSAFFLRHSFSRRLNACVTKELRGRSEKPGVAKKASHKS